MGTLQDELKKANLISKKESKKVAHQKRVRRKEIGREGLQQEAEKREASRRARIEEQKARDRRLDAEHRGQQAETEGVHQLESILEKEALREGVAGPRRFCYVNREGKVPFTEVSDDMASRLVRGEAAIVEVIRKKRPRIVFVPGRAAERIEKLDAEAIRFWNR